MEPRQDRHQRQPEETIYSLNREKQRLERAGITPSTRILSDNLDASQADIEDMEQRLYHGDISLEAPQHGDGDPLMDTLGSGEDIEDILIRKDMAEVLHKRLVVFKEMLSEKECFVLEHRIMAEEPPTLREIGEHFKTSRESIRQIQARVLRNLVRNLKSSGIRPNG